MAKVRSPVFHLAIATNECWKCERSTRVGALMAMHGSQAWDDDEDPPFWEDIHDAIALQDVSRIPEPIASAVRAALPTLSVDFSEAKETEYWMNHCTHCGARIGDFFLHMKPDDPFFAGPSAEREDIELLPLTAGEISCGMPYLPPLSRRSTRLKNAGRK